eukprot:COSAG01_NODE_54959_length_328_cov_1.192140_1_plen_26_part_01
MAVSLAESAAAPVAAVVYGAATVAAA